MIPFLNEGVEVERTVESIRETATENPDIVLINDASDDGYDYQSVAEKYDCSYFVHETRAGVANSREEGVEKCKTDYFLLLDAHMRFYEKGWDKLLLQHLIENPRALICCQSKELNINEAGEVVEKNQEHKAFGAFIDFNIFKVRWNYVDPAPFSNLAEIPCVYGAAYACSKAYWSHLHGLDGLQSYGTDEQFISIKVWMEGGKCLLAKDITAGHIYRKTFPYEVMKMHIVYNFLYASELLLPYPIKEKLFAVLQHHYKRKYTEACQVIKDNYGEIKTEKEYLKTILGSVDYFIHLNSITGKNNHFIYQNQIF